MILDEIYDLSIYDEESKQPFKSAIELFQTNEAKNKLIWLWGLSKVNYLLNLIFFRIFHFLA